MSQRARVLGADWQSLQLYSQSFYLSNDAIPRKETVQLTIDPARDTFEGSVSIDVELRAPTSIIWLNAKNLDHRFGIHRTRRRGSVRPEIIPGSDERIGIDGGQPLSGPGNGSNRLSGPSGRQSPDWTVSPQSRG